MTVKEVVAEGLRVHAKHSEAEINRKVRVALQAVGLSARDAARYPHMFSGGQQQRIAFARALVLNPKFIVLDEPTSALDVSIQATLLNLLKRLQNEFHLTYILISHDIRAIRALADRMAVMYLGRIVEEGPADLILSNPVHPYTKALLSAVPVPDPNRSILQLPLLGGDVPDPSNVPPGCPFHPRCPMAQPNCSRYLPLLEPVNEEGQRVACPPSLEQLLPGYEAWVR
jgi:peptide/nickel transport system ATP-binding protein/oligopeptide transport system ATP-binding protein